MYKRVQGSAVGLKRGLFNRKGNYWTSNSGFDRNWDCDPM